MSKKQSSRRKSQRRVASGSSKKKPGDHLVVGCTQALCRRCGKKVQLDGPYDPNVIDGEKFPEEKMKQQRARATYCQQVWDFVSEHRACKQRKTKSKTKASQKGLF